MLDILTASPCVGAYRADPLSIAEIDVHPDSARIWATIRAMQGAVDDARQKMLDDAEGDVEEAREEAWDECRDRIAKELARIGDRISAADRNALLDCLE